MNDNELLAKIAQQLQDHVERYDRDYQENKERFGEDREERRKWRDNIDERFEGIEKRIEPIVLSHQIIMKGGSWIVAAVGTGFAAFKSWIFVKDHLTK